MEWNVEFHRKSYTTGTQDRGETNMTITQDIQDRLAVGAALSPSKLNTWLQFWDAFNGRRRHEEKRTTWKACRHEDAMSLGDSDAASRDAPPTIDGTDIRLVHDRLGSSVSLNPLFASTFQSAEVQGGTCFYGIRRSTLSAPYAI